jgi:hypothetical protein
MVMGTKVNDPHKLVGRLVDINGEFGIIIACEYDNEIDDHVIQISFMDKVYGAAAISVSWTSALPFLVR